ncbi:hypothetical protein [Thermomonas aquatica]|uniref:Uncharacterized protein n=1 Tax=Thermomonas aquatica TaxID=2202149 RepID=A0A5B7ZU93_9GAMM|nr:hypothetical protein [Thermomonas aquatica]QDA57372.1 hypothetical protein FHQ07_08630 [Thermomonas aquatica]
MNALLARYRDSLSPALRRYYRASLWPSLLFIALAVLHKWAIRLPGLTLPVRLALVLAPVLCMAWLFACYLRFLRDCDELERRIELDALAWAAGSGLLASLVAVFLLDAGVVAWPARQVAGVSGLLLVGGYGLARMLLRRRYP